MNIPCINKCFTCPTDPPSVENFSSEAPDVDKFLARSYGGVQGVRVFDGGYFSGGPGSGTGGGITGGVPDAPPIGSNWAQTVGVINCESPASFEEAMLCAFAQWVQNQTTNTWPIPTPNPNDPASNTIQNCAEKCEGGPTNGAFIEPGKFKAQTQAQADELAKYYACEQTLCKSLFTSCTVQCPDGQPFTFSVPYGAFLGKNFATAAALAKQYACLKAEQNKLCLSPLTLSAGCVGSFFQGSIQAAASTPTVIWSVSSGTLPYGLDLIPGRGNDAFIQGTPISTGIFTFSISAQNQYGIMTKGYTITINSIVNGSPLPDADSGTPYTEVLTVGGPTVGNLLWKLESGTMPSWMTFDPVTGIIGGTPNEAATTSYSFTISVTDGH